MKKIHLIVTAISLFLLTTLIDLLFGLFIESQISYGSNITLSLIFTFIAWYLGHLGNDHTCNFTEPVRNKKVNENTRNLTHKCICGKENTVNVHKDSLAYKEFIHEI